MPCCCGKKKMAVGSSGSKATVKNSASKLGTSSILEIAATMGPDDPASITAEAASTYTGNQDALFDEGNDDESVVDKSKQGSVLGYLLSQVRIGMDLSSVTLPTYILERRSLLEMYADFFAHPDMFVGIADATTPRDRIVAVVRWYLASFHAGRKSEVAKKPYNPILGEIFKCWWIVDGNDLSASTKTSYTTIESPQSQVDNPNALLFYGEQVSHHPPVSAFYAEHKDKGITLNAHIWTKSKFLGLSVVVQNIGEAVLTLSKPKKEEYVLGFPNGYARSVLTVPWIELGGDVDIKCAQTGHFAKVDFRTKSLFGSEKHRVVAKVFSPTDTKKPFLTIDGPWNGTMNAKWADGKTERFLDVSSLTIVKKQTLKLAQQEPFESRKMWVDVTEGLKTGDVDKATLGKKVLEDKQRFDAKNRDAANQSWKPRMFDKVGNDKWLFRPSNSLAI